MNLPTKKKNERNNFIIDIINSNERRQKSWHKR